MKRQVVITIQSFASLILTVIMAITVFLPVVTVNVHPDLSTANIVIEILNDAEVQEIVAGNDEELTHQKYLVFKQKISDSFEYGREFSDEEEKEYVIKKIEQNLFWSIEELLETNRSILAELKKDHNADQERIKELSETIEEQKKTARELLKDDIFDQPQTIGYNVTFSIPVLVGNISNI